MADIHLTSGNDSYEQALADRDTYPNIFGDDGNDVIRLYSGTAIGGKGDDRFEFIPIAGETWRELGVAYWNSPKGVVANLEEGWADDGLGGRDTLIGVRRLHGGGNDDTFTGDSKANFFHPNGGHDRIDGRGGFDGIDVREIPPTASGSGTWRAAQMSDLNITVGIDGRTATISVKYYPKITYELTDIEYFQLLNDSTNYLISDFIQPQAMADQAIAAGGSLRWNAEAALGTSVALSFSFVTQAPGSGVGASGFRAFTAAEQQVVRDLLAKTALLAGISFTEVAESSGSVGQLRFGVSQQTSSKGTAFLPNQAGAGDQAGDVWMDIESMLSLAPGSAGYAALLHEIGHALGLRHPRNVDATDHWDAQLRVQDDRSAASVMSAVASADGLWRSDWGTLDVLALRTLYGSRSSNAGDTVYTLGASYANAQSDITDDGGVDTLDASSSAIGVSLDLAPGHFSSYGMSAAGIAGVDNVGLTPTSWIENANGTALDDVLLGNDLDNRLLGGLGNDWLDGAKGIDTAVFSGARSDYELSNSYGKLYVRARDGFSGYDTVVNIERLQFADQVVVLSVSVLGSDSQFTLDEDSALAATLPAPSDVDAATARYALAGAARHGTATVGPQGQFSYTPDANFHGQDSVAFDINANGKANRYVAYVEVKPINDGPPIGKDGGFLTIGGTSLRSHLPGATDIDGDAVNYSLASDPLHGVAAIASNGEITYQATAGYSGDDSLRYSVSDGMGGSNTYTARLLVLSVGQLRSGTDGADKLPESVGGDSYLLLGGDDSVTGGAGNDLFDGGEGLDTALYTGRRADFTARNAGTHWVVSDKKGAEGSDILGGMERVQFADRSVALDLDGHAGATAQILRALFGPAMLKSAEYAGYGIFFTDKGMGYADLVSLAISTDAFLALAHSRSNADFVKLVYQNVVGSAPSSSDLSYFTGLLDSGAYTQNTLAVLACQIGLNTDSIELAGLASTGLDYILPPA